MPLCATQFRRWTTPLLVSGVLSSVLFAASAAAQTREQAVTAAREGRLEEGISMLRALVTGDASPDTAYDLAVVLTWANHPKEATDAFEQAGNLDAPEYVLLAMTRAYWDQRRYDEAQRLAGRGRAAFPSTSDWIKLSGLIPGEAADRSGDPYTAVRSGSSRASRRRGSQESGRRSPRSPRSALCGGIGSGATGRRNRSARSRDAGSLGEPGSPSAARVAFRRHRCRACEARRTN